MHNAVHSTSQVDDAWSITDIAAIKDAMDDGHVDKYIKVKATEMIANCLTKRGAGAASMMKVVTEGEYKIPGGWDQIRKYDD